MGKVLPVARATSTSRSRTTRKRLRIYETLTSAEPDLTLYRSELADTCLWLAELHLDRNEPGKAKGLIEKARTTFDELSARGADGASVRGGRVRCAPSSSATHCTAHRPRPRCGGSGKSRRLNSKS